MILSLNLNEFSFNKAHEASLNTYFANEVNSFTITIYNVLFLLTHSADLVNFMFFSCAVKYQMSLYNLTNNNNK